MYRLAFASFHLVKGTMRKKEKAGHRYTKYEELFYIHFIGTLAATRGCFILSSFVGEITNLPPRGYEI